MKLMLLGVALAALHSPASAACRTGNGDEHLSREAVRDFYRCAVETALRLERAGDEADLVAIAAAEACDVEMEAALIFVGLCSGPGVERRLRPVMIEEAKTRAITAVVHKRANQPQPSP